MEPHQDEDSGQAIENTAANAEDNARIEYAGFWIRFLASVLDTIILLMVAVPLLLVFYGPEVLFMSESPGLAYDLINYLLPLVAILLFWQYRSATPGKIMMGIYIVDADTLQHPSFGRLLLRYLGYYVSMLPLFLGFIWVAFDRRKQGFHDKIANTVVVKMASSPRAAPQAAKSTPLETPEEEHKPVSASAQTIAGSDPWKE